MNKCLGQTDHVQRLPEIRLPDLANPAAGLYYVDIVLDVKSCCTFAEKRQYKYLACNVGASPRFTAGYVMESRIGCSHSQSQLG